MEKDEFRAVSKHFYLKKWTAKPHSSDLAPSFKIGLRGNRFSISNKDAIVAVDEYFKVLVFLLFGGDKKIGTPHD